jgi:hypothetical protein
VMAVIGGRFEGRQRRRRKALTGHERSVASLGRMLQSSRPSGVELCWLWSELSVSRF